MTRNDAQKAIAYALLTTPRRKNKVKQRVRVLAPITDEIRQGYLRGELPSQFLKP